MPRAPFQILVLPYRRVDPNTYLFAVFRRADDQRWQGIAGGGEQGETPAEAARREAFEEAGIPLDAPYLELDSRASIPVTAFRDSVLWGESLYVIPEHSFGVEVTGVELTLAHEHDQVQWLPFAEAYARLSYDSNRTALWELSRRVRGLGPRDPLP